MRQAAHSRDPAWTAIILSRCPAPPKLNVWYDWVVKHRNPSWIERIAAHDLRAQSLRNRDHGISVSIYESGCAMLKPEP